MNLNEAQDFTAMLLLQSVAAKAKAIFRMQPEIRVDRTSWTGDAEYQIEIVLPPGKYLYAADIEQFKGLAMNFEGFRSTQEGNLHVFWSLKLNHFIALQQPHAFKEIKGSTSPQNKSPGNPPPQKQQPGKKEQPHNQTLF